MTSLHVHNPGSGVIGVRSNLKPGFACSQPLLSSRNVSSKERPASIRKTGPDVIVSLPERAIMSQQLGR